MISKEQLNDLRTRILNHKVVNDRAVVELGANELHELVKDIVKMQAALQDAYDTTLAITRTGERLPHITGLIARLGEALGIK